MNELYEGHFKDCKQNLREAKQEIQMLKQKGNKIITSGKISEYTTTSDLFTSHKDAYFCNCLNCDRGGYPIDCWKKCNGFSFYVADPTILFKIDKKKVKEV